MKIPFEKIETLAASEIAESAFVKAWGEMWTLTRHSALYRCKDGSYTLHLVWHGGEGYSLTSTIRGIRVT